LTEVVRDFEPGRDEGPVEALWSRVFGTPRGGQTAGWLFRPGPAGGSPRTVAEIDGRIVAHAGGAALRFRLGGEDVRGAYSVGAMTDPDFQGRRLHYRVASALYERLEREGFAFVAGFSNAKSFRLFTGPLHRTPIQPFPWAVRPVWPGTLLTNFTNRSRGDSSISSTTSLVEPGDPRLDAVWKRASENIEVGAVRDAAFSLWRYGSRPESGYRLLLAERAGEPAGWLSYRPMTLRGVRAGFLLDFVLAPGEEAAGRALLREAAQLARADRALLLSTLLPGGGPGRDALRAAGFLRIPERLHPQLIRFSTRGLGRFAGCTLLANPRAWHLSWADTDVV
jgi:hypothetical protein